MYMNIHKCRQVILPRLKATHDALGVGRDCPQKAARLPRLLGRADPNRILLRRIHGDVLVKDVRDTSGTSRPRVTPPRLHVDTLHANQSAIIRTVKGR